MNKIWDKVSCNSQTPKASAGCFTCLSWWASGSSTKGKATSLRAKCCQTPWALRSELAKWSVAEPATATPLDKERSTRARAVANELQKQHLRKGRNQPVVNWCNSSSHFMQIEFNQLPFRQSSSQLNGRSRDKASHQIFPRQPTFKKMNFMLNLAIYRKKLTCSRSSYDESTSVFELKLAWSPSSQVGFQWNFDLKKKKNWQDDEAVCVSTLSLFLPLLQHCFIVVSFTTKLSSFRPPSQ